MPSPWGALLAADASYRGTAGGDGTLSWNRAGEVLRRIAASTDEWSGIPMPVISDHEDSRLVLEPSYPFAVALQGVGVAVTNKAGEPTVKVRNRFWSHHLRSTVVIWEEDGKLDWGIVPSAQHATQELMTLGAADAWDLKTEFTAMDTLRELVSHRQMRQYLLTGSFLESSKRSGLRYLFRKLRPTIAINEEDGEVKILAALCLHPIGYYNGSWAGALCPTDDVIAHLMLMRGDEPMFWRRANQHPAYRPEAGI